MLHCVHGGAGPVRHTELAVDVLDMVVDGLGADRQLASDALVGHPLCEERQHVALARRQPGRTPGSRPAHGVPGGAQHGVGGNGVEMACGGISPELANRVNLAQRFPVRAPLQHRMVGVGGSQDPCPCRQHRSADCAVIAGGVHPLVMGGREQADAAQRLWPVEDPLDVVDVQPHPLNLVGGQRPRLCPQRTRNPEPADVVYERGPIRQGCIRCRQVHHLGGTSNEFSCAPRVPGKERAPKIAEVANRLERAVEFVVGQRSPLRGLGGEELFDSVMVEALEERLGVGRQQRGDLWVEVGAATRADDVDRSVDARSALEDLARFRHV